MELMAEGGGEKINLSHLVVFYDGQNVWACNRSLWAINNLANVYDPKWRKSYSWYEDRLEKYVKRGFSIHIQPSDNDFVQKLGQAQLEVDLTFRFSPEGKFWKTTISHNTGYYRLALFKQFANT